jgi:hypothetical protein
VQQFYTFQIEGSRKKLNAAEPAMSHQLQVLIAIQLQFFEHPVLRIVGPGVGFLVIGFRSCFTHHCFCLEALKFHHIGTGSGRCFYQAFGQLHIAVVIDACFGYDQCFHRYSIFRRGCPR